MAKIYIAQQKKFEIYFDLENQYKVGSDFKLGVIAYNYGDYPLEVAYSFPYVSKELKLNPYT
jgi:hypothetical protein